MLAETVSVTQVVRYRKSICGPRTLSMSPDPIVSATPAESTSPFKSIGDSRGMTAYIPFGPIDRLALNGIVPIMPKVVYCEQVSEAKLTPFIGHRTKPVFIGTVDEYQQQQPQRMNPNLAKKDSQTWKTQRTPKQGQRVQVLSPR